MADMVLGRGGGGVCAWVEWNLRCVEVACAGVWIVRRALFSAFIWAVPGGVAVGSQRRGDCCDVQSGDVSIDIVVGGGHRERRRAWNARKRLRSSCST